MNESIVPLESLGVQLVFKVLDGTDRIFTTGSIPIDEKYNQLNSSSLTKLICEKCNEGEMVFNPSEEELENNKFENNYRHTCTNCNNEQIIDKIYPSVLLFNKDDMDKIETIKIAIEPVFIDNI